MSGHRMSRREWLAASPLSAAILAAQQHAQEAIRAAKPAPFTVLSPIEAAELGVIVEQIIPADETPGAREAGVVYFIDRALATFDSDKRELYKKGLAETARKRGELFPAVSVADLSAEQQLRLVQAIEKTGFFEQVRTHTVMGFFGNPSYGGNRNMAGWKLINFEDRFQFEPPFGYYDREANR